MIKKFFIILIIFNLFITGCNKETNKKTIKIKRNTVLKTSFVQNFYNYFNSLYCNKKIIKKNYSHLGEIIINILYCKKNQIVLK